MAGKQVLHNYELLYLAGGVALGIGVGLVFANREVRENVKTSLAHAVPTKKGVALPLGLLTIAGPSPPARPAWHPISPDTSRSVPCD